MKHTLLLIDDDQEMLELNSAGLGRLNYRVFTANNGKQGLKLLANVKPDCVVLDVMMPTQDGFAVCQEILRQSNIPVIFLTGRTSEDDVVAGLSMGADDYIEKPFRLRELGARINAVIRRRNPSDPGKISFPPLEISLEKGQAFVNEKNLHLTQQEYSLLLLLVSSPEKVMVYEEIGKSLWGNYVESDRRVVMVSISRLRKKLEIDPVTSKMIETIWSIGYKFTGRRRHG